MPTRVPSWRPTRSWRRPNTVRWRARCASCSKASAHRRGLTAPRKARPRARQAVSDRDRSVWGSSACRRRKENRTCASSQENTVAGALIKAPKGDATRPTTDRVRESLMSALLERPRGLRGGGGAGRVRRVGCARPGGAVAGRGVRALLRAGRRRPCARSARNVERARRAHVGRRRAGAPAPGRRAGEARPCGRALPFDLVFAGPAVRARLPKDALSTWWPRLQAPAAPLRPRRIVSYEHAAAATNGAADAAAAACGFVPCVAPASTAILSWIC